MTCASRFSSRMLLRVVYFASRYEAPLHRFGLYSHGDHYDVQKNRSRSNLNFQGLLDPTYCFTLQKKNMGEALLGTFQAHPE